MNTMTYRSLIYLRVFDAEGHAVLGKKYCLGRIKKPQVWIFCSRQVVYRNKTRYRPANLGMTALLTIYVTLEYIQTL